MENLPMEKLFTEYPYSADFFDINGLPSGDPNSTIKDYIDALPLVFLEDMGLNRPGLLGCFTAFMRRMEEIRCDTATSICEITILGGTDKSGRAEEVELIVNRGEIVCIVGPTGAGKSRLLADIEWMAQRDTPTRRPVPGLNGGRHRLLEQITGGVNR